MKKFLIIFSSWHIPIIIFALIILYIPILLLIINSFKIFNIEKIKYNCCSLHWYYTLFQDTEMMHSLFLSILIAVSSATFALILSVIIALGVITSNKIKKNYFSITFIFSVILSIPDVVIGMAMLLFFITLENIFGCYIYRGIVTIWLTHVTFCTAYISLFINSFLHQKDHSVEEAAIDLGASPIKTFFLINIPMMYPVLIISWMLAFTMSLDDFILSSFVTGPGYTTLPMQIFSSARRGINLEINALASLLIFFIGILSFLLYKLFIKLHKN